MIQRCADYGSVKYVHIMLPLLKTKEMLVSRFSLEICRGYVILWAERAAGVCLWA